MLNNSNLMFADNMPAYTFKPILSKNILTKLNPSISNYQNLRIFIKWNFLMITLKNCYADLFFFRYQSADFCIEVSKLTHSRKLNIDFTKLLEGTYRAGGSFSEACSAISI